MRDAMPSAKRLELARDEVTKLRERATIDYGGFEPVRAAAAMRTAGWAKLARPGSHMEGTKCFPR